MADYKSKYEGEEIDKRLEMAETASTDIEKLETTLAEHADQLTDHETRITNNYRSTLAIGGVATANQEAIEALQQQNETNSTRFTAMDQQIAELEKSVESASDWDLIPADYTTIADYAESLAVGRHHAFYRNASDTHVTDMPVNANCFIEISKYSNTSIHITVHPCLLQSSANYCRSCSGGTWGGWYKFEGAEVTGGTE